jgi:hypothetical protein
MSMMPPPLPLSARGQNDNTFSNRASLACLLSPLILIALGFGFRFASRSWTGPKLATATMVFGGVSCLLILVGLIMGILALLLMKSGGRTRIVVCSLGGLAVIGAQIALAVPHVLEARARSIAHQDAMLNTVAAGKDVSPQTEGSLKTNGDSVNLNKFSQAPDQAARISAADQVLRAKGTQAYLARLQAVQQAYENAFSNLTAARVLSTSNLVARESIEERRAIVQAFLNCNADVKNFASGSEDNYRAELVRLNVSQAGIEDALKTFHKSSLQQIPALLEIRAEDDRMGRGMLAVLDLLDVHWGHWTYNEATSHVRFEKVDVAEEYNAALLGIVDATTQRAAAEKRLGSITSQMSMQ